MSNRPLSESDVHKPNLALELGELWENDPVRNTILVVDGDPTQSAISKRLASSFFPNAEVVEVFSVEVALERMRRDLLDRVALILTSSCEFGRDVFLKTDSDKKIPLVFLATAEEDSMTVRESKYGYFDGISGPAPKEFKAEMREAIAKRRGLFQEIEKGLKSSVLAEFVGYYVSLIAVWQNDLESSPTFPGKDYVIGESEDSDAADLKTIYDGASKMDGLFRQYDGRLNVNLSDKDLQKFMHDLGNYLVPIISWPYFTEERGTLPEAEIAVIRKIKAEGDTMLGHMRLISDAYNQRGSWGRAQRSRPILQEKERMEFPRGTFFCLIDDDKAILKITKKTIEAAGGKAITIDGPVALTEMLEAKDLLKVEVFLLDNDLGGGAYGHQLVAAIREKYPHALIIAHTSDVDTINTDHQNPYREQGVEVVGKRAWRAVSGIVRRELGKSSEFAVTA
ncbi:response regulator [Candidatus Peregrinibacteria bacterium]|nr:response regulator [Candidatus Peregrinibacteria bacterium]